MIYNLQFKFLIAGLIFIASVVIGYFLRSDIQNYALADALSNTSIGQKISGPIENKFNKELQTRIAKQGLAAAGTYELSKIFKAPDAEVLNGKGETVKLKKFTEGKYTLLTFFYEFCSDAKGCPFAMSTMQIVKQYLEKTPSLSKQVRMVHISFDPERDTPVMMAGLEKKTNRENKPYSVEWRFLTTKNYDVLIPLIDGYGQNVDIAIDPKTGKRTLDFPHVLKIFLIDPNGYVREIYSTTFLNPEMLLNDIETLMIETEKGVNK